jgi:hypothetical protein
MTFFEPSPRQTNLLILLGCATLGYALYLRFSVIDSASVEAACSAGVVRVVCGLRTAVVELSEMQFFGGVALVASVVHFARPALAPFLIALVATILGLVLGNAGISGLAAGLLIIAFARPLYANRPQPPSEAQRRTIAPASSRTPH